ncbi:MAG: hypothetical protein ACOYMG_18290 [Candidatus Methylumidiphilus sp.]
MMPTYQKTLLLAMLLTSGCSSIGPDHLRSTHPLYNAAIVDSLNEQFLSNLVRLHYRDPTFFLDVASVAATMKLSVSGTVAGQVDADAPLTLGADSTYETFPTISYSPLQGEDFVKSLLSPISIDALLALTGSGWSLKRVFGLCVERINGVQNAPSASGPNPAKAPKYFQEWNHLIDVFDRLEEDHLIEARLEPKTKTLKVEFQSTPEHESDIREIKTILKLDQKLNIFNIEGDSIEKSADTLRIVTRPLMSTFFYLSHRVDVPEEHQKAGWVTITKNKDGSAFDWSQTPAGKLFHIKESEDKPENAFVAIPYESHWYYITKNDIESKSTFLLLTQLFRLQAGAAKSMGPTLTIPVK